jgi:hypothetical protein
MQMNAKTTALNPSVRWKTAAFAALAVATLASTPALAGNNDEFKFDLVRNTAFDTKGAPPTFAPHAQGRVNIESVGPVEIMSVTVWGLPPNTDFDFFVIQVPHAPFGLSWYQGDIETNRFGVGYERFVGRFNDETFIVAPGAAPAPTIREDQPFPDASTNPPTPPVQTYHLGLWFNDPKDAQKAGGPATVTPFNGEHHAGVQVLNTTNFPDNAGPLFQVKPTP